MPHLKLALTGLALSLCLSAQDKQPITLPPPAAADLSVHALPGALPGTERWMVLFKTRDFDLEALRLANRAKAGPEVVNPIVADLDARMRAHQAPFAQFVENLGGRVSHQWWIVNGCAVEIAHEKLGAILAHANVETLQPDQYAYPVIDEPTFSIATPPTVPAPIAVATNNSNHRADLVQSGGLRGAIGITTAIMDTGQDSNMNGIGRPHRTYFQDGNLAINSGGINGSRLKVNSQQGLQPADDVNGHGTGCASIVAGGNWLAAGADHGHAPWAGIVGVAIADNAAGSASYTAITNAWNYIAANKALYGIETANNSYSGTNDELHVSQQALDNCARNADILICVAAGNNGASTVSSQFCANGLAVAACSPTTKVMASFSSRGPIETTPQPRYYPDITGCGVSTVMALRNNEGANYVASGTSMASPQVCGAATLYRTAKQGADYLETKAALLATTESIAAQNPTAPYNDRNSYGMGFLRDDLVVNAANGNMFVEHGTATLATSAFYNVTVTGGQTYSAVVTWDRNNTTISAYADVDLYVRHGAATIGSSASFRNLYEKTTFTVPGVGQQTIRIEVDLFSIEAGFPTESFVLVVPNALRLYSPAALANVEGNSNNTFPYGGSAAFSYMQAHGDLNGRPLLVNRHRARRDGSFGGAARTNTLSMFMGGGNISNIGTTFLANYTTARTMVVASRPVSYPDHTAPMGSPAPFDAVTPLDAVYAWNGLPSAFLWEMRVTTAPTSSYPLDADSSGTPGTNTGTTFGAGCIATGRAVPMAITATFGTSYYTGHNLSWTMANAVGGMPSAFHIGVANANLPIAGLCSNYYVSGLLFNFGGVTNAAGSLTIGGTIQYNASYIGAGLTAQGISADLARPNPIKVSVTNGIRNLIPATTENSVIRIYTLANAAALTGTLQPNYGIVICLD